MPIVKYRTLSAGPDGVINPGEIREVSDEEAKQLEDGKYAIIIEDTGESKSLESRLKKISGGYYELPNGEKIKGKEAALEALKALDGGEDDGIGK